MYGKLQKQREDMQFYIALRHVDITGAALSTPELLALQPLLRSNSLQLAAPVPGAAATCVEALQAAADFGVGPEQAADATAVCALIAAVAVQPSQQQGRHDQWPRIEARPTALQQVQSQGAAGQSSAQQQRQQHGTAVQRVTAGIRSILGRRGAAAAAVAGSSEAGPSKRPQQQQQPSLPQLPDQQPGGQQQQLRQVPPLWLSDVVPAEEVKMQPLQQQQQQQIPQVAGERGGTSRNSSRSGAGQEEPMMDREHLLGKDHMQQEPASVGSAGGGSDGAGTDAHDMAQGFEQQDAEEEQQDRQIRPELGAELAQATQRLTEQIALRLQ